MAQPQKSSRWIFPAALAFAVLTGAAGCKPRTPSEKIQDTAEDAAHEAKQGVERTGKHLKEDVSK
jgi:hypothetical protein